MRRLFGTVVLLAGAVGLYLLAPRVVTIVQGAPTLTVTPSGEYDAAGFQIYTFHDGTSVKTGYCNLAAVGNFSGGRRDPIGATGTVTFSATGRCNGVVQQPDPQTFTSTYEITGTNEFVVAPPAGDPNGPVHGRTLNGGDVLLLDGTTRFLIPAGGTGSLVDYVTAVRP